MEYLVESVYLWNILLTGVIGLLSFIARSALAEQQRMSILLNRTREELARDYLTKQDAHTDFNRILDRMDRFDEKLDRLIESWNGVDRRK
jgi:hypothetical protein